MRNDLTTSLKPSTSRMHLIVVVDGKFPVTATYISVQVYFKDFVVIRNSYWKVRCSLHIWQVSEFVYFSLTTEFVLELQSKLVNEIKALHQEDMVFEGRGCHGPQGCHISSGHSNSKDLDAFLSGLSCHLCHAVLRTSICHNHSYIWNLQEEKISGSNRLD